MSKTPIFAPASQPSGGVAPADHVTGSEPKKLCFHCGTLCRERVFRREEKFFCCQGCLTVFELLTENGLAEFYNLSETAGVRVQATALADRFNFLDEPLVRGRLVDFANDKITRVTFLLPAVHCVACFWLLENLFQLRPGIKESRVNFPRREVLITFENERLKLSAIVTLLASLGYEPELQLSALETKTGRTTARRLWMQIGFAGFAFGNIMLFSLAGYFGLDTFTADAFRRLTGYISLALALPVVTYSALDYWRAAWVCLKDRALNIDVPIALGIGAIFLQSTVEVIMGRGDGYFDSLCGLIFFLLCGKLFQQKNYDRLTFDRNYKSFFPLSVTRLVRRDESVGKGELEEQISISQLVTGERLILRNGELIPADATLMAGPALIDYSFVTGESEPVEKKPGDHLYAGGRQLGGRIEVETVKAVSESYLTSLWDQDSFRKDHRTNANALTNQYSRRFTKLVIAAAVGSAAYWAWANPALSLKAFTSVLIVACPCALALAAPFALGTAQRVLARRGVYLKNSHVLEQLAKIDAVVFDKTGTLTAAGASNVTWHGSPLNETEERWLYSLTRHSTHPLAVRIGEAIKDEFFFEQVRSFLETAGGGMEANVAGNELWMGSAAWLESRQVQVTKKPITSGSLVHVAFNGKYRGCFVLANALRPHVGAAVTALAKNCQLALLSGDNETDREKFHDLFGQSAEMKFNQSPLGKLNFVRELQSKGKTVMMVGDGLNDAGALKQSDVGVAVVENAAAFSPASDVILSANMISQLDEIRIFARRSVWVVRAAFIISSLYNVIGLSIAASGQLAPVVCAILMPVSSITVVSFACLVASWNGRRLRVRP